MFPYPTPYWPSFPSLKRADTAAPPRISSFLQEVGDNSRARACFQKALGLDASLAIAGEGLFDILQASGAGPLMPPVPSAYPLAPLSCQPRQAPADSAHFARG